MTNNENLVETLNDLVRINNDRVTGYDKAANQAEGEDVDLKAIFSKMASESRDYIVELDEQILTLGGKPDNDSTFAGKIYRTWMDVKNTFTGSDRTSILETCEFGEDAAQRAYNEALESDAEMDASIRQLIMAQKNSLKTSHDIIKKYRDLNKAVQH
ncbi:MAG: PA2169 family four-helix-bundle protein [Gloeobacteraceae cyanobacterium ES-bin-316]|nr:PA2169 family four-helix-bundle protein [Ferruginibacter sp.]